MIVPKKYDCAIIGGGVAGLSLAILLARSDKKVILLEKENFPFHKVCGEYISNESIPFLQSLGVNLESRNLPKVNQLFLSSPSGIAIQCPLSIGGTGLSRYALDHELFIIAVDAGVEIRTQTKVVHVDFQNEVFQTHTATEIFHSRTAIGAFGKNTNIDVQLNRKIRATKESNLFIAVKYHIYADFFDQSRVEMHNFRGGYCGLSAIEDNKINMSYISNVHNLKREGGISNMEKNILSQNPHLKKYFDKGTFIFDKPLTISHLHFEIKDTVRNHILMLGDAAGNIAPLSGNGMSIALQSAKLSYQAILLYLNNELTLSEMENQYSIQYYQTFSNRIKTAKQINSLSLYSPQLTNLSFRFFSHFPNIVTKMSKQIHGDIF